MFTKITSFLQVNPVYHGMLESLDKFGNKNDVWCTKITTGIETRSVECQRYLPQEALNNCVTAFSV